MLRNAKGPDVTIAIASKIEQIKGCTGDELMLVVVNADNQYYHVISFDPTNLNYDINRPAGIYPNLCRQCNSTEYYDNCNISTSNVSTSDEDTASTTIDPLTINSRQIMKSSLKTL